MINNKKIIVSFALIITCIFNIAYCSNNSNQIESCQVNCLPWENDVAFKKCQLDSKALTLLAAYKTVLHDPLPGEEYNVHLAAKILAGTVIKPSEVFSQNGKIGPYTESRGFQKGPTYIGSKLSTTIGGGVCKIASTLYNVVILSNLQIVERHAHSMPVPYVPYGQDATVSYGVKDFKFKNNTRFPLLIWAKGIDNTLYIAFYGSITPPKIEWQHNTLETKKAGTSYVKNTKLPLGTEKLILQGADGAIINSSIKITDNAGNISIKDLGKSYYNPMNNIIEINK